MHYTKYFRHTHPCYTAYHHRLKNIDDEIWSISEENSLTDIDAQAFKYDLGRVEDLHKRIKAVANGTHLGGIHRIDRRRLKGLGFNIQQLRRRNRVVLHTKNIGCFKANFSTPPLIILVLNVMIPACKKKGLRRWYGTIAIAHHLNGSAERHLKKINGCQENEY